MGFREADSGPRTDTKRTGGKHQKIRTGERDFSGLPAKLVDAGLASISVLIIYWTLNPASDVVIKRSLYLMMTLAMCAVVYPFSKRLPLHKLSVIDSVIIVLSVLGSLYIMYDYQERFLRLSNLNNTDIFFGIIMILIGLDIGRRVIGWALTLVASGTIIYALFGNYIPGTFGHPGFDVETVVSQVYCGLEGYYGMASRGDGKIRRRGQRIDGIDLR
ncbi:MAG: hypothetical protein P8175_03190 [Deltaproteobacteria bacterium]